MQAKVSRNLSSSINAINIQKASSLQDNVLIELVSATNVYVFPRELFWNTPSDVNITGEYHKIRQVMVRSCRQVAVLRFPGKARAGTGSCHPEQLPAYSGAFVGALLRSSFDCRSTVGFCEVVCMSIVRRTAAWLSITSLNPNLVKCNGQMSESQLRL